MSTDEHILLSLRVLEQAIPPPEGRHHAILATMNEGEPKLTLQLATEDGFHAMFFDRGDLDMHPTAMANAVITCYENATKKETTNVRD